MADYDYMAPCDSCHKVKMVEKIKVDTGKRVITFCLCTTCYRAFQREVQKEAFKILSNMIDDFNPSARKKRHEI